MSSRSLHCGLVFLSVLSSQILLAQFSTSVSPKEAIEGHIPLVFESNEGQAERKVRFLSRGPGYDIFINSNKIEFRLPPAVDAGNSQYSGQPSTIEISFLHSSADATPVAMDRLSGKSNYFIGKDPKKWISGVPQHTRVSLKSLYPGIDAVYHGNAGQFECDFVISPGADPALISFHVDGVDRAFLDDDGDLRLELGNRTIALRKPLVYQESASGRRTVAGAFVARGNNDIGFAIGHYDTHLTLVVDPVLSYSTLIGADNNTQVQGIAVDSKGDVYVTGTTFATNYPTVDPFQSTNRGTTNVFITKLNPAGNVILYSSYIGSSGFDNAAGIAVDGDGSAYVTGTVGAADFPTTSGAFMTACPSLCNTPFVSKFLSDGTLAFSTFMGGSNSPAHAIAVDTAGEAYIAGDTASNDLPTTPAAFEPIYPGMMCTSCYNGYVEKLNAPGSALVYSTYFGSDPGHGFPPSTAGSAIAIDTAGSVYLVGNTTDIPVKNPLQSSVVGGPNAFITKFSPDGSSLIYSTYLGGTSPYFFSYAGDYATGAAVDSFGNVHVVGTSSSCDFPLSLNALSTECVNQEYTQKIFVTTLNPSGSQIVFSTFLENGFSSGIAVDSAGNSYVTGTDTSDAIPILNAIDNSSQTSATAFVTELDPSGKLLFSTYLGGMTAGASAAGIALDHKGAMYVVGDGQGDFPILHPIPKQTYQSTYYTFFISKISPNNAPQFSLSPRVSPVLVLRNVSSAPLTIDSITASSNFTQGGNCGSSLAPGTGCTLILEGAADKKTTGTVTITSNADGKPQKFVIDKSPAGDYVGSILSIFPLYPQFPLQLFGTTSSPQSVVIANSGLLPATINSIQMIEPAAFAETNNCPGTLNPGNSCTISVTYTAATQSDSAQLAIIADPSQTRYTVFLNATGSASALAASSSSVNFGTQYAGAAPLGRMVNVTNTTPYPATLTGISTSTEFGQINTCTAPLAPYASCRVSVSYSPVTNEITTGALTIGGLGPGGPQQVALNGNGFLVSSLAVSPIPLALYSTVRVINETGVVTVTNTSTSTVTLKGFSTTSLFSQANNCPTSLAALASCSVNVTFTPTATGIFNGTLSIANSGPNSPQVVPLVGTAQAVFNFSQATFDLGTQQVSTTLLGYAGFANYGSSNVTVDSVTVQGTDFKLKENGCPSVFTPLEGCGDVEINFTPSATGIRTGTITVVDSDPSSPHIATLQGLGISSGVGTLSSTSLDFGTQAVGTQSSPQNVTLTNTGAGVLKLSGMAASSQFTQTNTCGSSLKAGAHCTISIGFAPTMQGILDGSLTVQDDGAGSPHTIVLSGIGQ
jgi:hypothetical protein